MRFPYVAANNESATLTPRLDMTLAHGEKSLEVFGLVDSGSTVNVLPYSLGIALGSDWNSQPVVPGLAGSLRDVEVRAVDVFAFHRELTTHHPIRLIFAWAKSDNVPVIFGQMNFFIESNVCFYRSQSVFEVSLK